MRYKIYVKDVLSTDSGLCVVIAILNGKDTQICLPKDCGIESTLEKRCIMRLRAKRFVSQKRISRKSV